MTSRAKLSERQMKVLRLMQEGYHLHLFGCFSGHVKYVHIVTLEKKVPDGVHKRVENTTKITVNSLLKRGLIDTTDQKQGGDYNTADYELTQKGRAHAWQNKV